MTTRADDSMLEMSLDLLSVRDFIHDEYVRRPAGQCCLEFIHIQEHEQMSMSIPEHLVRLIKPRLSGVVERDSLLR